jgi:hypothetical protein
VADEGRIVVVGAGPHALTFCSYLLAARPDWHSRLLVIDPDGWLTRWDTLMERLEIDVLRSPGVHHPDPASYALFEFAIDRPDQLHGDTKSPTVGLFADFCTNLIARHRLHEVLEIGTLTAIIPRGPGHNAVELESGAINDAATVVIAANQTTPRLPGWAPTGEGHAVTHAAHVHPSGVGLGERVVVVGGGLTAAQLCAAAMRRCAEVTLVARHPLRCSGTDVEPGWLSRYLLEPYLAEPDWERRAGIYRATRRGTMPAFSADVLRRAVSQGHLVLHESAEVSAMTASGDGQTLFTTAGPINVDRVWLATGWTFDARTDPLMAPLLHVGTTTCGLPLLDAGCAIPGTTVHLTGAAAALQTGAFAPNLAGARIAAERIVATLCDLVERQYPVPPSAISPAASISRWTNQSIPTATPSPQLDWLGPSTLSPDALSSSAAGSPAPPAPMTKRRTCASWTASSRAAAVASLSARSAASPPAGARPS